MGKKSDYREWAAKQMEQVQPVQIQPWSDYEAINQLRAELAECKRELEHWKACHTTSVMMNADVSKEMSRLRKIEAAAVWACDSPQWRGDDFDNCMYALDAALKGEK